MSRDEQGLDFSTVIASTVHDMKNSLSALIQAHDQWLARLPEQSRSGSEQGVMEHEFRHLNGMLVQLLGLYKLGINQLPICPDYHELEDFVEAQLAAQQEVIRHRDVLATWRIDTESQIAAVMTVVGPTSIFHADEDGPAARQLLSAARTVSWRMGYEA